MLALRLVFVRAVAGIETRWQEQQPAEAVANIAEVSCVRELVKVPVWFICPDVLTSKRFLASESTYSRYDEGGVMASESRRISSVVATFRVDRSPGSESAHAADAVAECDREGISLRRRKIVVSIR